MSNFIYYYAECRYAECHYAECRYAECRGAPSTTFQPCLMFASKDRACPNGAPDFRLQMLPENIRLGQKGFMEETLQLIRRSIGDE